MSNQACLPKRARIWDSTVTLNNPHLLITFQQLLIEKFRDFARDTTNTGSEKVAATNAVCDQLIGTGHTDAATIAEWKDQINESWSNLLELIETRTKVNKICFVIGLGE